MNLLQDLAIVDEAGQELVQFEEGQATTIPPFKVGAKTVTVSVQKFGATQPPAPYQIWTGSAWNIISLALMDAAEIEAGQPIQLGAKAGNDWYGVTLQVTG